MTVDLVSSEEVVGEQAPKENVLDGKTNTFWHNNWKLMILQMGAGLSSNWRKRQSLRAFGICPDRMRRMDALMSIRLK